MRGRKNFPIGIDFGTTNTVVYYYNYKRECFMAIPNHLGKFITPTFVFFGKDKILFGKEAVEEGKLHPENAIFDVKRMIGKNFNDADFQNDMKNWPFKVVSGKNKLIYLEVDLYGEKTRITPEEVAMYFFRYISRCVKKYFKKEGFDFDDKLEAVLTVPAHFSNSQRSNTELAAKSGGFNVLRIIDEPSSAGISFWYYMKEKDGSAVVFDLGGGTFDVSLIEMNNGNVQVINKEGDPHLGGHDLDYEILKLIVERFKLETNIDLTEDKPEYKKALKLLEDDAEEAKIALNTSSKFIVKREKIIGDYDINCKITINDFNYFINKKYMNKCKKLIKLLFKRKGKKIADFEGNVILVGGSSRIPAIQKMLSETFIETDARIYAPENQDECVALGAAIMCKSIIDKDKKIILMEMNSNSIGVKIPKGKMVPILPRMTPYKTKESRKFETIRNYQKHIKIDVYEGECKNIESDNFLGSYKIKIPRREVGKVTALISLYINESGILVCTAIISDNGIPIKEEEYCIEGNRFDCHKTLIRKAKERIVYENEQDDKKEQIEDLIIQIQNLAKKIKRLDKKRTKSMKQYINLAETISFSDASLDERINQLKNTLEELKEVSADIL